VKLLLGHDVPIAQDPLVPPAYIDHIPEDDGRIGKRDEVREDAPGIKPDAGEVLAEERADATDELFVFDRRDIPAPEPISEERNHPLCGYFCLPSMTDRSTPAAIPRRRSRRPPGSILKSTSI